MNKKENRMAKGGRRVKIFSALEVANICGVVNQTAINWIRNGHLKAFTTPGGQYRIYAKDLAAFLDLRGMGASDEVLQVMTENANWNVLLIAAEQYINDELKTTIENLLTGYQIIQSYDWLEIGIKITRERPGFILLDAELPGADTGKFIQTVKDDAFYGRPKILLMSGSASFNDEGNEGKRADAVFTKPLDLGKLETAVKILERHLDQAIA